MSRPRPEPVQVVKQRRDGALHALIASVPFAAFLDIRIDRRGDELTFILPFSDRLIGNPMLPAIHGGVTAAFLEVTAIVELAWSRTWQDLEGGQSAPRADAAPASVLGAGADGDVAPRLPKTIDFTVDYLRSGLPRDAYARARVNRFGRRYASVHVEAWQDNRQRLFAQATGHFMMGDRRGASDQAPAPDAAPDAPSDAPNGAPRGPAATRHG
ncbi:PaaI family thioesterase [Brevirhabdus sp.]|uniref:PaaI family thioesterase n=1 Tax=Brevirhabdus sp. TaxID=2004514 RepID=UPI004059EABA